MNASPALSQRDTLIIRHKILAKRQSTLSIDIRALMHADPADLVALAELKGRLVTVNARLTSVRADVAAAQAAELCVS